MLGWIDDEGEWHAFPPPPEWDPRPLVVGEWIRVDGKRRQAVADPFPLFRVSPDRNGDLIE